MAQSQLPPKVPAMIQNWSSSPFQMMPMAAPAAASQQNSWVDEFLDFSTARRSAHRRSTSDPIAFVEAEECGNNNNPCNNGNAVFEGLDDEQLRSMFSDDIPAIGGAQTMSSSGPSTPSDQNSENQEKMGSTPPEVKLLPKSEPEEAVDSSGKPLMQSPAAVNPSGNSGSDAVIDPKRIKRILANRQSAQRSRVRKLQYISELERSVTTLQTEVSALSPRVAFLDHQRLILNVDNSVLKQRIAALAQDKIFKDAHQEALRKEIERLRQIYHEQHMKKAANEATNEATQPQNGSTPNFTKNIMDQE